MSLTANSIEQVVVVGAGFAGLTAAYELRDRRPLVLESRPWVGGRAHSERVAEGKWMNLGAAWLPMPVVDFCREMGVEVSEEPLPPPALWLKKKRVIERDPVKWFLALPFTMRARYDFLQMGVRFFLALRHVRNGGGADLDQVTLADWLGDVHPDLQTLIAMWTTMAGARSANEVSALAGLEVVNAAVGRMTYHGAAYHVVVGGTARLAEELASRLGDGVVTGATVTRIAAREGWVEVAYRQDGQDQVVRADQCIVAVPLPEILEICQVLPPDKARALEAMIPASAIACGIHIEGANEAPWDNMYWLRSPGQMSNLINHHYFVGTKDRPEELRCLSVIISGAPADDLLQRTDEEIARHVLRDLEEVFPEARGHASVRRVVRHEPAYVSGLPGSEAQMALRAASVGRVHFCGADLVGVGTDHAVRTGRDVAERVRRTAPASVTEAGTAA